MSYESKLFVDDIRACPEGWTPARTVTEAIRLLATADISEVSLDHDIQCPPLRLTNYRTKEQVGPTHPPHASEETFEAVAWYLKNCTGTYSTDCKIHDRSVRCNCDTRIGPKIRFHTSNIDAGKNMANIIGVPYKFTHYPCDFRKNRDVKEPWEGENE